MQQIVDYYNKIYENQYLYSLVVAILLPFLVIVVGYFIGLISEALGQIVGMALSPVVANALVNYVFFPGVMLHELAHAFFAIITGAEITEVALFKRMDDSLGHVNFKNRGPLILVALQDIFVSSAPMFVGAVVVFGCFHWISILPKSLLWLKIILGYIGTSMFFHMTMSPADIKVYVKGIPLFIPMVFVVTLILRLTNVI